MNYQVSTRQGLLCQRLVSLRWVSVGAMTLLALVGPRLLPVELAIAPLLAVAALLGAANLLLQLGGRRARLPGAQVGKGRPEWAPELTFSLSPLGHLLLDLFGWSAFVFCSGGATNPLISILLPVVAIGATILPAWQAWLLGGLAIAAYSYLWLIYLPLQVLDPVVGVRLHLAGMWLTFAGSALVVVWFITRLSNTLQQREQALIAAREQALRQDWVVSLGSLAAGTAHEMSTPLATLTVLVEELQATQGSHGSQSAGEAPRLDEDLALMRSQLAVCRQALDRLAAQAGYARGEGRQPCAVAAWLDEQAAAWRTLHPEANIALTHQPPLDEADWQRRGLQPDPALAQAVHNLVDNAVGVSPLAVAVHAALTQAGLELCITDAGPGLPDELRNALGERPVPSAEGMGIGLFLSRASIERQGGQLLLSPREDGQQGTTARIILPLVSLSGAAVSLPLSP